MVHRMNWLAVAGAVLALVAVGRDVGTCRAASISYGNFGPVPPGVTFVNVIESSATDPVPLYGPPAPFSAGLDFDPLTFAVSASGGGLDFTDGQLNFTVRSDPTAAITAVSLSEGGDYALDGVGTPNTHVLGGALMRVYVTQIDGVDVAPIGLVPVNASFGDFLPGGVIAAPWSIGLLLDVGAQLGPDHRATEVEVVIDNQLLALSEPSSLAFIAKKDFRIDVRTAEPIVSETAPEPAASLLMLLGGLGCVAMACRGRACIRTSRE